MVRRASPSQLRSRMRQAASRAQRSLDAYNRARLLVPRRKARPPD